MKTSLVGRWRIAEMEQWDQDYVETSLLDHLMSARRRLPEFAKALSDR